MNLFLAVVDVLCQLNRKLAASKLAATKSSSPATCCARPGRQVSVGRLDTHTHGPRSTSATGPQNIQACRCSPDIWPPGATGKRQQQQRRRRIANYLFLRQLFVPVVDWAVGGRILLAAADSPALARKAHLCSQVACN